MHSSRWLSVPLLLSLSLATGCGSGASPTTSTAAPVGGGIGGPAKCTPGQISKAVSGAVESRNTNAVIDGRNFRCADGWAVARALVGEPPNQVPEVMIFEAEGQFWIPKDREAVCGNPPQVPQALYGEACEPD